MGKDFRGYQPEGNVDPTNPPQGKGVRTSDLSHSLDNREFVGVPVESIPANLEQYVYPDRPPITVMRSNGMRQDGRTCWLHGVAFDPTCDSCTHSLGTRELYEEWAIVNEIQIPLDPSNPYAYQNARARVLSAKMILDSGERREFHTGAVRDMSSGKGRYDLLPPEAIFAYAKHMEDGAAKYEARNWEKGIQLHSFWDSAVRHLFKYLAGKRDEDHLAAAFWNIGCLIATRDRINEGQLPESLDDLPNGR
jgi:hypothetical protein